MNKALVPVSASKRKAGVKKPTFKKGISGLNLSKSEDVEESSEKKTKRKKLNLF